MSLLEHEWSPAIAVNAAQSMHAGVTPCCVSAPCAHRRCSLPVAAFAPEAIELCLALGVELLDREHGDVAVLGVDPRAAQARRRGQARGDERGREGMGTVRLRHRLRYLPRAARSSSTKRSTASVSASRG
jgi:hypothetical protein